MAPVGRLALERGVAGRDPLGVDAADRRPVVGRHRLDRDHPVDRAMTGVRNAPRRSIAEDHLVAGFEVPPERRLADLEQAAGPDRPAPDQVARREGGRRRTPGRASRRTRTAHPTIVRGSSRRRSPRRSSPGRSRSPVAHRPARRVSPATVRTNSRSPCPWRVPGGPSSRRAGGRAPTSRRRSCSRRSPPRRGPR